VRAVPQVSFGTIGSVEGEQAPPQMQPGGQSSGQIQPQMPGAPGGQAPGQQLPPQGQPPVGGPPAAAPGPQDGQPPFTG
jgi:LemA protein